MSADLRSRYLGLALKNPIVAAASPRTNSLDKLKRREDAGVAAVVLPSLFEEQIEHEEMATHNLMMVGAELSPEAATGGPLALVQDGDSITIDLDTRRIDAALTDEQWQQRRDEWRAPVPAQDIGWLQQYRRNVGSLSAGAVLVRTPAKAG